MDSVDIYDLCWQAIYVLIITSAPAMLTALFVGLAIGLLQALTQIQEATLTFVPKILAVFLVLAVSMPFMLNTLIDYTNKLQEKIVNIE